MMGKMNKAGEKTLKEKRGKRFRLEFYCNCFVGGEEETNSGVMGGTSLHLIVPLFIGG